MKDYQLSIQAPENSIDWLNGVLQTPDLLDQAAAKRAKLVLTDEIKKLKEQTEKNRKAVLKDLKIEEQNAIRRMNRLLLELLYKEAPKGGISTMPISLTLFRGKYSIRHGH